MRTKLIVGGLLVAGLTALASPAWAASNGAPNDRISVAIEQKANGGDEIRIRNLDTSVDSGALFNEVEAALGLDVAKSSSDNFDAFSDDPTVEHANTHQNLFADNNGTFTLSVSTSALATAFDDNGVSDFAVGVCPLSIPTSNTSSRAPDSYDSDSNCSWWKETTASANDTLHFGQTPAASSYWRLVGWLIISAAITAAVLVAITILIRHARPLASSGHIALAAILAFVGWLSALIASLAIFGAANSLDEFTLAHDLTYGASLVAGTLPGLLFMVPFVLPAILLVSGPSPDLTPKAQPVYAGGPPPQYGYAPQPTMQGPGVPDWLNPQQPQSPQWPPPQPGGHQWSPQQPPQPQWAPQQQPQQWAPQQPVPQPPAQQPQPEQHQPQPEEPPKNEPPTWHPPA